MGREIKALDPGFLKRKPKGDPLWEGKAKGHNLHRERKTIAKRNSTQNNNV